jgi:hypothetical protein
MSVKTLGLAALLRIAPGWMSQRDLATASGYGRATNMSRHTTELVESGLIERTGSAPGEFSKAVYVRIVPGMEDRVREMVGPLETAGADEPLATCWQVLRPSARALEASRMWRARDVLRGESARG